MTTKPTKPTKPTRPPLTPIALLFLAGLLAACRTTTVAPSPGYGDPVPPPHNDPQITVLSSALQEWLAFQPAVIDHPEDGPMRVQVPVRNMSDRRYLVQYRFLFYDERDFEVAPQWGWERAELLPKELVRFRSTAPGPAAVSYRLEVKWAE